jgi:hypothetical protein
LHLPVLTHSVLCACKWVLSLWHLLLHIALQLSRLGLLLQQDMVDQKRLGLTEGVLTIMYGEAQKNLQQLELILATTSPSFNIIDQPYSPIQPIGKSKVVFGLIGFVLSAMFTFIFIWVRIWLKTLVD